MFRLLVIVLCASQFAFSGYATPNTGVQWNIDSLVFHSNGVVTGTFPVYVVNDTVIISAFDSLRVFPGTTIKIQPKKPVTIRGKFSSIGTFDSLITFTRNNDASPDSVWKELRFEESAVDSSCVLQYTIVEYSQSGINCVSASPTIEWCESRYNGLLSGASSYGIQCFNSDAIIRHSLIYGNKQYGININSNANPTIEFCIIRNNNLQNTGFKNQISVGPQGINSPKIRYNEIYHDTVNITVGAISISAIFAGSGSSAEIVGNAIHHNAYGIALLGQNNSVIDPVIRNNQIVDNRYKDPYFGGSGINCNGFAPAQIIPVIEGNLIDGNMWGITIQGSSQPNIGNIANQDSTDDGRNTIIRNANRDTVFALYNNTGNPIVAQNNNWGTNDPDSVALVIFDAADIASLGTVTYLPLFGVTSVRNDAPRVPASAELRQNYPNPFNPATTISFRILKSDFVNLEVFDIVGRKVETIVNGPMEAGAHSVVWNAGGYASGMYYYRLSVSTGSEMRKMTLVK